jgi:putative hydrolase of the HAD superfamily
MSISVPARQRILAVTFDVGGTLLTPHPSVGHIYAEVAARHGYKGVPPALLNRRFAAAWRRLKNFHYTRAHWAGLVDATFRGLIPVPPSRSFFPTLYERFAEPGAWRIYEDALPVLEAQAARGVKLGIISNWDERLRPLLRARSV